MTFIKVRPEGQLTRIYDPDRGLDFASGGGAHGMHRSYFHALGNPDDLRGGGINWHREHTRELTEEERERHPPPTEKCLPIVVESGWGSKGGFQIKGYSRRDSLAIIKEALLAGNAYTGRGAERTIQQVEFSPIALAWGREE